MVNEKAECKIESGDHEYEASSNKAETLSQRPLTFSYLFESVLYEILIFRDKAEEEKVSD